jgi:hypothetical protein
MSASSVLASLKPSSAAAAAVLCEDAPDFSSELTSLITRWRRIILNTEMDNFKACYIKIFALWKLQPAKDHKRVSPIEKLVIRNIPHI